MHLGLSSITSLANSEKGYILEASPLPKLPVTGLQSAEKPFEDFYANLDHQSREEEAINGRDGRIEYSPPFARYPVVLMLDGVVSSEAVCFALPELLTNIKSRSIQGTLELC